MYMEAIKIMGLFRNIKGGGGGNGGWIGGESWEEGGRGNPWLISEIKLIIK